MLKHVNVIAVRQETGRDFRPVLKAWRILLSSQTNNRILIIASVTRRRTE